jgi:hypothetical protein
MWLRDALPVDEPELRVWIYGYDFNLLKDDSIAGIDEHSEIFRHLLRDMRENMLVNNLNQLAMRFL